MKTAMQVAGGILALITILCWLAYILYAADPVAEVASQQRWRDTILALCAPWGVYYWVWFAFVRRSEDGAEG